MFKHFKDLNPHPQKIYMGADKFDKLRWRICFFFCIFTLWTGLFVPSPIQLMWLVCAIVSGAFFYRYWRRDGRSIQKVIAILDEWNSRRVRRLNEDEAIRRRSELEEEGRLRAKHRRRY